MSGFLSQWVRGMASAAVVCGIALAVTPSGKVKNVLKVICGAVMVMAFISPLAKDGDLWTALDIARYRQEAGEIAGEAENNRTNISKSIIKQELEAYVLDKALSLGIEDLSVELGLRWSEEGFWYPCEIWLSTPSDYGRAALESLIEGDLGIPSERQYWSTYDD